jgi:hypothetical protein
MKSEDARAKALLDSLRGGRPMNPFIGASIVDPSRVDTKHHAKDGGEIMPSHEFPLYRAAVQATMVAEAVARATARG